MAQRNIDGIDYEVVDTNHAEPVEHPCGFAWCQNRNCNDGDHWGLVYYPAGGRQGALAEGDHTALKFGIGTKYHEEKSPAVIIHIDGGGFDYDADAYLTISEAVSIHAALGEAITDTRAALEHLVRVAQGDAQPAVHTDIE